MEDRHNHREREKKRGTWERTPEIKHSLTATNCYSPNNSPMFYVLFIPLAAEHKRPSVICGALVNRGTSSAKSKTRGHDCHHHWFVNRQVCPGVTPAGAHCGSSRGHQRWHRSVWKVCQHRTEAKRVGHKRNKFLFPLCVLTVKYTWTMAKSTTQQNKGQPCNKEERNRRSSFWAKHILFSKNKDYRFQLNTPWTYPELAADAPQVKSQHLYAYCRQ